METRYQTTARNGHSFLRLLTSIPSPYTRELSGMGNVGRNTHLFLTSMKAVLLSYTYVSGPTMAAVVGFQNGSSFLEEKILPLTGFDFDAGDLPSATTAVILAEAVAQSYTMTAADIEGLQMFTPSVLPASYQTIVSQTGTSAPAVSGGFAPVNTYASGTTFTWARTGAGVYTLTASSAVFNTSGKTGVFIAPLTNLNAQARGVVTSSTVLTFTTAVGSVAVLGLLGLTATNTDALLSNTMVYVQTYS